MFRLQVICPPQNTSQLKGVKQARYSDQTEVTGQLGGHRFHHSHIGQ